MGSADKIECRRSCNRLKYIAAVKIVSDSGELFWGSLHNISQDGIYVKFESSGNQTLNIGRNVDVAIMIMQGDSRLTIETAGLVVRKGDNGIGIQFRSALRWWPFFSLFPVDDDFMLGIVASA